LTINQLNNDTIRKSSSTDDSQFSQHQYKTNSQNDKNPSVTTTTSSSGILNDQQSLLKQSSRKQIRISNLNSNQSSYRQTLLQALNPTTDNFHQLNSVKKLSKMIHSTEKNSWSANETTTTNDKKCLMLTQNMINGSTGEKINY